MSVFLSAAIIFSAVFLTVNLFLKNARLKDLSDPMIRISPWIFLCEAVLVASDLVAGGDMVMRMVLDMSLSLVPLAAVTSSVWRDKEAALLVTKLGILLQTAFSVVWLLCAFGVLEPVESDDALRMTIIVTLANAMIYSSSLFMRIRDVRAVMQSGTIWLSLCLAVDSVYILGAVSGVVLHVLVTVCFPHMSWASWIIALALSAETFALGFRISSDSLFVLWHRQERRIAESMKVSHVEVAHEGGKEDDQYKEVYERVVAFFEKEKPYLNGELTINDVVKVVFTNKLYISRAISQYTGRNFCQFVNYYRVTHSVRLFRCNPEMKIVELANASGFNSVVSFNMAFRLFMNENPSDWCRKERLMLLKGKNKLWNR